MIKSALRRNSLRWGPAILMMGVIFLASSIPSSDLPDFDWADLLIKKGGHVLGFGLIALSYWRGLGSDTRVMGLALALAVLFAISDEIHQSFTPGRSASPFDVLIDAIGSALALALMRSRLRSR